MPRPPALQTAATNSARARLPIGACTIGCRIPNFSVSLVVSILAPSLLSIPNRVATLPLLDHLVRALQEQRRDRQPERHGGLQVDDQLKLCRLLDGDVAGLGPLQDAVHVEC